MKYVLTWPESAEPTTPRAVQSFPPGALTDLFAQGVTKITLHYRGPKADNTRTVTWEEVTDQ